MNLKGHILISYARVDGSDFALRLHDDLEARRINAWIDVYDIDPGEDFYAAIARGISEAVAVVVVLTPGAVLSQQVTSEWNSALNKFIPVIPLLVVSCEVPNILNVLNRIDFREEYASGIAALRRRIARLYPDHLSHLQEQLQGYRAAQANSAEPERFQPKVDDLKTALARWELLVAETKHSRSLSQSAPTRKVDSLEDGDSANMRKTFVGREAELAQLNNYLHKMLQGQMQIAFVAGDAGTGKSALITEFSRHAHEADSQLLYVTGQCNDITGMSDAYLPFRHVLGLLTGDQSRLASATMNEKNATRLNGILKTTGRALLEIAPELVGTLIPGGGILVALGKMGAKERGLLSGLEEHAEYVEKHRRDIEQSQLVMQYTALLRTIAEEHPLVIVIDDLQWSDRASIGLLFHLVRELRQARILLIGLYRPNEIVTGYGGEPHPLKHALRKILNEIKRYESDVVIDLNKTTQDTGRAFVDAMVDTFPNRLDLDFRETLFQHTGGHALFTVELLEEMKDRGDLVQDGEDGSWHTTETLDWTTLPNRVEAVVEERIERLKEELRETLTVASVEGPDFTAQVVARVRKLAERDLLRQLSRELEKHHQLVQEKGESKVGKVFFSHYSFSHALFHRYLYNSLSTGERRMLHSDVAEILEGLYAGHTDRIATQIALHYTEAGNVEKAATYLIRAGENTFNLGEVPSAQELFERALSLLGDEKDDYPALHADLLWWMGETYYNTGRRNEAEPFYRQTLEIARQMSDADKTARGLIGLAQSLRRQYKSEEALRAIQEALEITQQTGNRLQECQALRVRGIICGQQNRNDDRLQCYEQAHRIAVEIDDITEQMGCLNNLGVYWGATVGNYPKTIEYYERALSLAIQTHSLSDQAMYLGNLVSYRRLGNYQQAMNYAMREREQRKKIGYVLSTIHPGIVLLHTGDIQSAIDHLINSAHLAD